MRKAVAALALAALLSCLLTSCAGSAEDGSRVELTKRGRIIEYTEGDFSASYYDADEFEEFVDEAVESYEAANDGRIKVKKEKVRRGTARLTIRYDSPETYAEFNGLECFAGSVAEAIEAGYELPGDIDPEEESSLKVFIIETEANVEVPGEVSCCDASVGEAYAEDEGTVAVFVDEEASDAGNVVRVLYE